MGLEKGARDYISENISEVTWCLHQQESRMAGIQILPKLTAELGSSADVMMGVLFPYRF